MKKYLLGSFAVVVAIALSSFTTVKTAQVDSYFWYTPDGSTFLGHDVLPNTGCDIFDQPGCAKGYTIDPSDPTTETPQRIVKQN